MLKFIDARRLRNAWYQQKLTCRENISKRYRTEDMMHYAKPTLKKHPKQFIIYVGSNDRLID